MRRCCGAHCALTMARMSSGVESASPLRAWRRGGGGGGGRGYKGERGEAKAASRGEASEERQLHLHALDRDLLHHLRFRSAAHIPPTPPSTPHTP